MSKQIGRKFTPEFMGKVSLVADEDYRTLAHWLNEIDKISNFLFVIMKDNFGIKTK
jgi:hypothetical protein